MADERFEHTELELLRKLLGDDSIYTTIVTTVKQADIEKQCDEWKQKIDRQNLAYASSVQAKQKPIINFDFSSTDFLPDGTFKLGGFVKKTDGAKIFMKKLQEGFKKLIEGKGKSSSTAGKGNAANN